MLRRGTPNISYYLIDDIYGFLVNKSTKPLLGDLNLAKVVEQQKAFFDDEDINFVIFSIACFLGIYWVYLKTIHLFWNGQYYISIIREFTTIQLKFSCTFCNHFINLRLSNKRLEKGRIGNREMENRRKKSRGNFIFQYASVQLCVSRRPLLKLFSNFCWLRRNGRACSANSGTDVSWRCRPGGGN